MKGCYLVCALLHNLGSLIFSEQIVFLFIMIIAKVRPTHHIYPKERIIDKWLKTNDAHVEERIPVKLLMLLLCEWDLVQAKLISPKTSSLRKSCQS
jgi:hypothetical protein